MEVPVTGNPEGLGWERRLAQLSWCAVGHRWAQASLLATCAYTSGRTVRFDPVKEEVLER